MESKLDALKANMEKDLNELKVQAEEKVHAAGDEKALQDAKVFFLGKKGKLTAILRSMKDLSAAEGPHGCRGGHRSESGGAQGKAPRGAHPE